MQQVDDLIIDHIHKLVNEGVRSIAEMERHLQLYVKQYVCWENPAGI